MCEDPSIERLSTDPAEGTGILLWIIVSFGILALGVFLLLTYGC